VYVCFATMGFTVKARYLLQPTQRMLKVLHLANRKNHRLTVAKYMLYNMTVTSVNKIINHHHHHHQRISS